MRRILLSAVVLGTFSFYAACGGDDTSSTEQDAGTTGADATTPPTPPPTPPTPPPPPPTDSGSDADNTTDAGDAGDAGDASDGALPLPTTTGLALWLAADNGVAADGGTVDGGDAGALNAVTTWLDKSGSGNHVSQATAALEPAVVPNDVNGKPALRFAGANKLVGTSTTAWDFGTNPVSWFYVAKSTNPNVTILNSNRVFGTLVNASPFSGLLAGVGPGDKPYAGYRFNVDNFIVDSLPSTGKWVVIDSSRVGNQMALYRNGLLVAQSSSGAVDVQGDAITIGAERTGGVEYFTGDIAEILIYNRSISTAERRTAEDYLSQKYGFSFHQCANVTGNLVSWYKANGSAADATGTNNGAINGNVFFAPGVQDQAFAFTAGSYVEAADNASLDFAGSFTLETWMSADSLGGRLIDKITAGGSDGYLLDTVANKLRMIVGTQTLSTTSNLPTGGWVHVAGVFTKTGTGAGTITLYVNGAQENTGAVTVDSAPANALPLRLGIDSSFANQFAGRMDDTRLWNRALTANEVQALFASGPSGKCP